MSIASYRLRGRLGEGGMGTVYLAETPGGRRVALKTIHPHLARHEAFRARFAREVAHARLIDSPFTPAVVDADVEAKRPYLVTAYVPGPTVHNEIREHGPLDLPDVRQVAVNVLSALTAFHRAGIVHRDIKPANVILSRTGPKVIDLGISRALDDVLRLTPSGFQQPGTWQVMAPEQWNGDAATTATDIFAWGCLVVYAGTGWFPFDGTGAEQLRNAILTDPPRLPDGDPALRDILARALDKAPECRPSAEELLATLLGTWPAARHARVVSPVEPIDDVVAIADTWTVELRDTRSGNTVVVEPGGWIMALRMIGSVLHVATLDNWSRLGFERYLVTVTGAKVYAQKIDGAPAPAPRVEMGGFWDDPPGNTLEGAISPDGYLVAGRLAYRAILWDVRTGRYRDVGPLGWDSGFCDFSVNGQFMLINGVRSWDVWADAPVESGTTDRRDTFADRGTKFSPDSNRAVIRENEL
ncbi:serine/threonine-protein kinase [Frankia sp. R43]|uniref:serine/threonine-protein kinase n=1 Tax=Frankia sp. R43 TaxID=269536 RepID=UPI0013799B8B|nr:serine/threonine-protein kinase [Frankia sp. R43]